MNGRAYGAKGKTSPYSTRLIRGTAQKQSRFNYSALKLEKVEKTKSARFTWSRHKTQLLPIINFCLQETFSFSSFIILLAFLFFFWQFF